MKKIFLTRGTCGSGKTKFIKENKLENNTLSYDQLRKIFGTLMPDFNRETYCIPRQLEKTISETIKVAAKQKMLCGETIFIDATNTTNRAQNIWSGFATLYGYETYIIDIQQDTPLEELLKRNHTRPAVDQVPEEVLINFYEQAKNNQPSEGIAGVITPNNLKNLLTVPIENLDEYEKIIIVGDIQGRGAALERLIAKIGDLDNPKIKWIFEGDLFDRGHTPEKVMQLLQDKPFTLITGNHEEDMLMLLNGLLSRNQKLATRDTFNRLTASGWTKKDIKKIIGKSQPFYAFTKNGVEYWVTHGGITPQPVLNTKNNDGYTIGLIPDRFFIYGTGSRDLTRAGTGQFKDFEQSLINTTADTNIVQIHGHRRDENSNTSDRVYCLESEVENGGELTALIIDNEHHLVNVPGESPQTVTLRDRMLNNPNIRSNYLGEGITAFNFTRNAFSKKSWDKDVCTARGFFLKDNEIVGRGYSKFFNIGEPAGFTRDEVINFKLPVNLAVKENGYLSIVTVVDGEIKVWSKSGVTPFSENTASLIFSNEVDMKEVAKLLTGKSALFEIIDTEHDPHITRYDKSEAVLLDIITNKEIPTFSPLTDLEKLAQVLLCRIAPRVQLKTQAEIISLLDNTDKNLDLNGNPLHGEGYVLRDAENKMAKIKTKRYVKSRSIREELLAYLEKGTNTPTVKTIIDLLAEQNLKLNDFLYVDLRGKTAVNTPRLISILHTQWEKLILA